MHILKLPEPLEIGLKTPVPACELLVEDIGGAHLVVLAQGGIMKPLEERRPFDESKDWNGRSVLFVRAGGFGDLVLMTPVFREIKRRWPTCKIGISTMCHYGVVLENLPFIDAIEDYPITRAMADLYEAWVFFERAVEGNPRARQIHMTDLFAEITGISEMEEKQPAYKVLPEELAWCLQEYPRKSSARRLCVQVGASAACRVYPMELTKKVCYALSTKGWEVFLMGAFGEVGLEKKMPGLRNVADDNLTFRQSCAVMNNADCFLGMDSAMLHVAGALGVPAVGLYGPFPWQLRTAYSPSITAISGNGHCAPCFHHVNSAKRNHWPENGPCRKLGYCGVLAEIEPQRIVTKIELVAKRFKLLEVINE